MWAHKTDDYVKSVKIMDIANRVEARYREYHRNEIDSPYRKSLSASMRISIITSPVPSKNTKT